MHAQRTLATFDGECAALLAVVEALTTDELARPTNCPPWTLHQLVVHIADSIQIGESRSRPAPTSAPPATAADYYRRDERHTVAYRRGNVDETIARAAAVRPEEVAELFAHSWRGTSRVIASRDPLERTQVAGLALTLDAYLLTRVMSVAAHGLDVAITLGRPPFTTRAALRSLRPVLVDLLDADPPAHWTDLDLLVFGTGRGPLTAGDRLTLGAAAARFPLLS
jgi:uncharacterized protein (TIGR03083 family)